MRQRKEGGWRTHLCSDQLALGCELARIATLRGHAGASEQSVFAALQHLQRAVRLHTRHTIRLGGRRVTKRSKTQQYTDLFDLNVLASSSKSESKM